MAPQSSESNVHFTVLIRLPFPRGDFVDPLPAAWSAAKDRALWDILSRPSTKGDDIDWQAIADRFDVTLPFLLQQAAWLYDRQLSQVRAQMLRVGNTHSSTPSPGPTSVIGGSAIGGQAMKRVGSGGSRVPSRLSAIQNTNQSRNDSSSSTATRTRGIAPAPNRTSSTNTVTQYTPAREPSPRPTPITTATTQDRQTPSGRFVAPAGSERPSLAVFQKSPKTEHDSPATESSSDESSDESEDQIRTRRMPGARRFGRFSTSHKPGLRDDEKDDDEDDDSPAFLPFSRETTATAAAGGAGRDMSATLRLDAASDYNTQPRPRRPTDRGPNFRRHAAVISLDSSASSAGGGGPGALGSPPPSGPPRREHRAPGPPGQQQRTAAGGVPHASPRRSTSGKESSEDTPSMGSSFSDLDDASVTQSALEEALLSNMQHGGMASRMSTISQALRSRYL